MFSLVKAIISRFDGSLDGVILLDIRHNIIRDSINSVSIGDTGFVFVIDADDNVIYSPANKIVYRIPINILKEEFDYIVIDGSPVMGLDNLFIEIADHIVIPTFLDNITTHSVLSMLKKVDLNKVKAIVPNRIGRTKLEKEYYDFLNKKLSVQGIHLSFPIPQLSLISKLIDNETLLWESKAQKLDYIKGIFISIWKEIDNE